MKNPLYNKLRDSYAIWNGSAWEDKNVPNAYFYSIEKAKNNGYYEAEKDLNYFKKNAEEDYIKTPISVLRYISELEKVINSKN